MRRTLAAVGATLTASALILGTGALVASAAIPQTSQANAALRYLYSKVATDGSVAATFGPGATEDTVISVADNGYDPATLKSPSSGTTTYSYLSAQKNSITTAGGAAKYVLTWIAAGKPAAIDGAAVLNKLNKLAPAGYRHTNGAFFHHTTGGETPNAYSQSLAVLADLAAGHALPANAVGWLTCAQRADGGFGYQIHAAAATPPAFCGDSSSDTNDTAIFLQALGKAGVSSVSAAAESYLHSAQQTDGGFGFPGSGSDPNSDAAVIQALVAIGQDPTGPAWTKGSTATAVTDLESFADPQGTGGYVYPGSTTGPDAFTTSGIPQALALKPYGAATTIVAGSTPPPATTPTPTPAPTQGVLAVATPSTGAHDDGVGGAALPMVLLGMGLLALMVASLGRRDATTP
jgi:hypothetical protein